MADRGDVFQLKRRLGCGAEQEAERVVIVQASPLNSVLPTMIAVPLEPLVDTFAGSPLAVTVSAQEAGATDDHVAIASWLHVVRSDRLAPGRVGKLLPRTMGELGDKLRLVLDL
jgi:mRNA-degrading endonuclease toxin of MazEF toxin-antitoxin module